jgi:hypothetical protein
MVDDAAVQTTQPALVVSRGSLLEGLDVAA